MDFSKCKSVQINENTYCIPEHCINGIPFLKKIIEKNDNNTVVGIYIPNASIEDINKIISLVYNIPIKTVITPTTKIADIVHLVTLMVFMSINTGLINDVVKNMTIDYTQALENTLDLNIYNSAIDIILINYALEKHDIDTIKKIAKNISENEYLSREFKIKLISTLIYNSQEPKKYDIILGISIAYGYNITDKIVDILSLHTINQKMEWKQPVIELYNNLLNIKIRSLLYYYSGETVQKLTNLSIDDKNIQMIDHDVTITKGTCGGNILMSLVMHITSILLNIEQFK